MKDGHGGDQQQVLKPQEGEEDDAEDDPDEGSRIVHRPDDPEVPAAVAPYRQIGHHGIPGGAPHLARTVEDPERDEPVPRGRQRVAQPGDPAAEVAQPYEDLALAGPVGDIAREGLRDGHDGVADPVDEAQDGHVGPQGRDKEGPDRVDHVRPHVVEKRREGEGADGLSGLAGGWCVSFSVLLHGRVIFSGSSRSCRGCIVRRRCFPPCRHERKRRCRSG